MEKMELEVYSQATNQAIVRMPTRRFPGLVIQGDSMAILANRAEAVYARAKSGADAELIDEACMLKDLLNDYLLHYEIVLGEHDIQLPYSRQPFFIP